MILTEKKLRKLGLSEDTIKSIKTEVEVRDAYFEAGKKAEQERILEIFWKMYANFPVESFEEGGILQQFVKEIEKLIKKEE